ncbi:FecCD family ABC transporter permease [Methylocaldum szegediense]|uniref:FecCD family ABC transporter permease n=1 Tax=Methylocaldum szegediense TaxID=73780 RepID=UPI00192E5AEA|nr:iron ABC transporter permease [Methylocaldum szegediense]
MTTRPMIVDYRLAGLLLLLVLMSVLSLTLGRYPIALPELVQVLVGLGSGQVADEGQQVLRNVLFEIRLPRILAAVLVGAGLSVSGAAFQAIFVNPLVSPGLLGVLAGGSFGAALGMIISDHSLVVQVSAFLFGLLAVLIALGIVRVYRNESLLMLVLGGIISSGLFTALLSIVKYLADPYNQLPAIVYWLMGNLSNVELSVVLTLALPMLAGILLLAVYARHMNVLSMGDEEARSLGIDTRRVRLVIILSATLISALTVVMAGMIGWIGLIVPHIARLIVGPDNGRLVPASALLGGIFLLVVDDLARNLFTVEIPIGVLSELLGIPIFILVLRNARKGWSG